MEGMAMHNPDHPGELIREAIEGIGEETHKRITTRLKPSQTIVTKRRQKNLIRSYLFLESMDSLVS